MSTYRHDGIRWLESPRTQADLARGFAAEVADPAWMLGRQWQLGEHQGEDASSPVTVTLRKRVDRIESADGPDGDGAETPPEVHVESEPGQWWTVGRRVRIGRSVVHTAREEGVALPDDPDLRLDRLPPPYAGLDGGPDGRALWRRRDELGLDSAWFQPGPPAVEPTDRWDPAELAYHDDFHADAVDLPLRRYDGGGLDWYSVDASAPVSDDGSTGEPATMFVTDLRYPGAPTQRWWQIEQASLDIGGQPPERSHFATLLLAELLAAHSDDWFTFPLETDVGSLLTLFDVEVTDSFGDVWTLSPPDDWSLFRLRGLDGRSLVVWPTAATPLEGPRHDEVVVGVDEDANLLWAVERRLAGRELATPASEVDAPASLDLRGDDGYAYRPAPDLPERWHPYRIEEDDGGVRWFVQCRLADLSGDEAVYAPEPVSDLLYDPAADGHPVHRIQPATVPSGGLRLERRYLLARRTDGSPVLWSERRRTPLSAPPAFTLRFDLLEPAGAHEGAGA